MNTMFYVKCKQTTKIIIHVQYTIVSSTLPVITDTKFHNKYI